MDLITSFGHALSSNWQTFNWLTAIFIFLAYFVLDTMYVKYMLAVVNKKAFTAANVGSLMYVLMAFGVLNYTQNFLYIISLGLGSWLGTYVIVKREADKKIEI